MVWVPCLPSAVPIRATTARLHSHIPPSRDRIAGTTVIAPVATLLATGNIKGQGQVESEERMVVCKECRVRTGLSSGHLAWRACLQTHFMPFEGIQDPWADKRDMDELEHHDRE